MKIPRLLRFLPLGFFALASCASLPHEGGSRGKRDIDLARMPADGRQEMWGHLTDGPLREDGPLVPTTPASDVELHGIYTRYLARENGLARSYPTLDAVRVESLLVEIAATAEYRELDEALRRTCLNQDRPKERLKEILNRLAQDCGKSYLALIWLDYSIDCVVSPDPKPSTALYKLYLKEDIRGNAGYR